MFGWILNRSGFFVGCRMSSRLASIRAKIEWAEHHIREFESRQNSFLKINAYELVVENDPQKPERIYKIKPTHPLPLELPLIAGDAIHNLRSALDHLACQLVESNGNAITNDTAFPIHQSAPKNKIRDSAKVKGIDPRAIDLIEAAQPYMTNVDGLWRLHKLDISDKHKLLYVVGCCNTSASVVLSSGSPTSASLAFSRDFSGAVPDDGAELGRIAGAIIGNEVQQKLHYSTEIAFLEPEIAGMNPVLPLLEQLTHLVDAVIQQFAPFL